VIIKNEYGADKQAASELVVNEIYVNDSQFNQINNYLQDEAELNALLSHAARLGQAEACHFFILLGANVNTHISIEAVDNNRDGQNDFIAESRTPLIWAIIGTNNSAIVSLLLKAEQRVN